MGDENGDADGDEEAVDDDCLPSELIRLFALEHEHEARQGEDKSQSTSGPGVPNNGTDGGEEASHQSANHQQNQVEDHHVSEGRQDVGEERVHHLKKKELKEN